jgi:DNA polymerase delta subunit 2
MESLPHIYFVGNQEKYDTRLYYNETKGQVCRMISVPSFSETNSFVVVNLRNLDTFEITL